MRRTTNLRFLILILLLASISFALPSLKISTLSAPATVSPGASFTVQVQVLNSADEASNVLIYPEIKQPFLIKEGTANSTIIGRLSQGASATTDFSITLDQNARSDTYILKVLAEISDKTGISRVYKEIPITVKGTPLLELIDAQVPAVFPGEVSKMTLRIKNIGTGNAKNIRVLLLSNATSEIAPIENSVQYIESIQPGQSSEVSLDFSVQGSALAKNYPVSAEIKYQDDENLEQVSAIRYMGVKVKSNIQLRVFISAYSGDLAEKTKGTFTVTIANTGPSDAQFLFLKVLSEEDISPKEVYIGTLDSEKYDTVDLDITPSRSGKIPIQVQLSYKDQYNSETAIEETLQANVLTLEAYSEANKTSQTGIYAIVVLAILGIYYFIRRKHKKQQ
jgi:hypothetical protein